MIKTQLSMFKLMAFTPVKPIFDLITKNGGEVRVVGGAVRDSLFGRKIHDIDLATTLLPQKIIEIAESNGIRAIPTGLEYGTVTLLLDDQTYEITTLRRDISTDGRHAQVTYTQSWEEDAARRDFTFNALYLGQDGTVYDYSNGQEDLKHRIIRFIGDAGQRIDEDVLRILRAYRFQAQLSGYDKLVQIDEASEQACAAKASLIPNLSAERVWQELSRLLSFKSAGQVWQRMHSNGVAGHILPKGNDGAELVKLCAAGKQATLCSLASLIHHSDIKIVSTQLKLSKADRKHLIAIFAAKGALETECTEHNVDKQLYWHGKAAVSDALNLLGNDQFTSLVESWVRIDFPLHGRDLLAQGLEPGERIGQILKETEAWWLDGACKASSDACLAHAKGLI